MSRLFLCKKKDSAFAKSSLYNEKEVSKKALIDFLYILYHVRKICQEISNYCKTKIKSRMGLDFLFMVFVQHPDGLEQFCPSLLVRMELVIYCRIDIDDNGEYSPRKQYEDYDEYWEPEWT